jgi:MFS family permease
MSMSNKKIEKSTKSNISHNKNIDSKSKKVTDKNVEKNVKKSVEKIVSGKIIHPDELDVHNKSLSVEDVIQRNKREENENKKESLEYSILDGSFWAMMFGFGERYLTAFAVFLKATNLQIGLLTSLPILIGSILQLFSVELIDKLNSRKKVVTICGLVQVIAWFLIIISFFMGELSVYFLILFATIYWVAAMASGPAWNSWMGDLVDEKTRGQYFGKRNRAIGVTILFSTIVAGLILEYFSMTNLNQYFGFFIIFLIALLARIVSVKFINKKFEPELKKEINGDQFGFIDFLKNAGMTNYGVLVLFLTFFNFSVYLSAPYFAAYMLYDLGFTYLQYMIMISIIFIARYLSLPAWGLLSDTYGNRKILILTALMLPWIPLLWMTTTNFYHLILVELYSGVFWAGFELSTLNFIFDTTTSERRAKYISYYNALNGIMIFLGTTIGSFFVVATTFFWSDYYPLFVVSFIFRLLIIIYFIPKLKEVRQVSDISYKKIFLKATDMIITESFHSFTFFLLYPKRFKVYAKPDLYRKQGRLIYDRVVRIKNKTIELQVKGVTKIKTLGKNDFAIIHSFGDKQFVEIKKLTRMELLKVKQLEQKEFDVIKSGKLIKIDWHLARRIFRVKEKPIISEQIKKE